MPHIAAGSSFTRRAFISAVGALGVASISQAYDRNEVLRPPGAGFDFLSKCIRCGKCVEACPYGSIQLLGIKAGVQLYSPYIDPLQTPCYLCREKQKNGDFKTYDDSLRCGKACPTGALRKIPNRVDELSRLPKELKTGVAKLNRNLCIAWQFQFCSDCYLSCPLKDKALLSRPPNEPVLGGDGIKPHVDANACMGCGQCTYVCPVRRSSGNAAPENFENKYGAPGAKDTRTERRTCAISGNSRGEEHRVLMTSKTGARGAIKPLRRLVQISVLAVLMITPLLLVNSGAWTPSLNVHGYLPSPSISFIAGDTWSFEFRGFRLTHPVALLDFLVSAKKFHAALLASAFIPLALTALLGRIFCSWICPAGFLLELAAKIEASQNLKLHRDIRIQDLRYVILVLALALGFAFSVPIISLFDVPHVFGREVMLGFVRIAPHTEAIVFLLSIVLFEAFIVSRAWCRFFCPSGACLSLLGIRRVLRISADPLKCNGCKKCLRVCPYGISADRLQSISKFKASLCDNCGLCRDACPTGSIFYNFKA